MSESYSQWFNRQTASARKRLGFRPMPAIIRELPPPVESDVLIRGISAALDGLVDGCASPIDRSLPPSVRRPIFDTWVCLYEAREHLIALIDQPQ